MKRVIKTVVLLIACCNTLIYAHAQTVSGSSDTTKKEQKIAPYVKPKAPKPITHEVSVGYRLNSNGWSLYTDIGKLKTKTPKQIDMFHNVRFWQLEFTEKKHPKEKKITGDDGFGGEAKYIYGKINNFYALKLGMGYRKMIAGKPEPGTVSIHWVSALGGSLGLVKPYFLKVYSDPTAIKYSDAQTDFLDQQMIRGSAGFSKGLDQISFVPGGHAKSAIHFDFSTNKKGVLAMEAGINAEYYSKPISILANQKPSSFFFDAFLAIQVGKRW